MDMNMNQQQMGYDPNQQQMGGWQGGFDQNQMPQNGQMGGYEQPQQMEYWMYWISIKDQNHICLKWLTFCVWLYVYSVSSIC